MNPSENQTLLDNAVPEKFKDPESGALRTDALLQSYKELEKRLSQNPSAPKSHDEYCINCDHGLFQPDEELNKRLHEKGFTQEQAQEVYNLAAERLVPIIMQMSAEFQADREVEKLVNHFGGADKWQEVSRQLLAFGQKNLPPEVLDNMTSSYEGVLALHRMMQSQEPGLKQSADVAAANAGGAPMEKELQSMMRDPRYWREKDPAFVAKVTEGFKSMYGNS